MKKMLSILTVLSVSTPLAIQAVSCSNELDLNNPYLVGKNIDKSQAKDSSGEYQFGVSNFYVIGDSLSDQDGLSELINNKLSTSILKINLQLGGDGYGYDENGVHHSNFSNGPTASVQVSKALGLETFNASNQFVGIKEEYGKNYSVGGATAGQVSGISSILLNDVTVDKQTKTLISQQIIHEKDIVFFEIGGNDLMSMIDLRNSPSDQLKFMNDSLKRLRIALLNLLNNDVKNIIFMTPPIMSFAPRYANKTGDELKAITSVCSEYYENVLKLLNEINPYYNDSIHLYDLYKYTLGEKGETNLEKRWLDTFSDSSLKEKAKSNLRVAYTDESKMDFEVKLNDKPIEISEIIEELKTKPFDEVVNTIIEFLKNNLQAENILDVKIKTIKAQEHADLNSFFFTDFVHPTKGVHELVSKDILNIIEEISKTWKN
ncbi:lipolytic enzyme, GDSL family [Entomoplasma ellychniae]|uniref:Lipolytic enzyme, GDSL family n=1 Tax=Entomoplasma ellychniae TaxID=2114 RepID=A0A8E2QYK2_9MOLU|nr:SGNH/GDSL hydrolase family protein [Entomoplasma ellychniae]PPE04568.1 lipolytic enzyme, GDSL family [Entomoplasma ellychniae]